ncbi:hypothetical protein HYH02_008115 [Chlamydomonas schloesseri]|uniref:Uncharacterized protein n=1 Tax=Chlamydomonas schloesseri TaxID=2026947 RepID=A0A836B3W5_9CHLO|nr:hypothetical protein HYH02_008115 [Chlamydomonas schloesseri]|eukprot:KAG2446961.1 hypothetical protein HYH02_008115 [Chlamydomonas schloesseri]
MTRQGLATAGGGGGSSRRSLRESSSGSGGGGSGGGGGKSWQPYDTCVCVFDFDETLRVVSPDKSNFDMPAPDGPGIVKACKDNGWEIGIASANDNNGKLQKVLSTTAYNQAGVFTPEFFTSNAFQYHWYNKTISLEAIKDYYDTYPQCMMLFDDMEHNRKYADAAGVIFQKVSNDTGVRWSDFDTARKTLANQCWCAKPKDRSYGSGYHTPPDRDFANRDRYGRPLQRYEDKSSNSSFAPSSSPSSSGNKATFSGDAGKGSGGRGSRQADSAKGGGDGSGSGSSGRSSGGGSGGSGGSIGSGGSGDSGGSGGSRDNNKRKDDEGRSSEIQDAGGNSSGSPAGGSRTSGSSSAGSSSSSSSNSSSSPDVEYDYQETISDRVQPGDMWPSVAATAAAPSSSSTSAGSSGGSSATATAALMAAAGSAAPQAPPPQRQQQSAAAAAASAVPVAPAAAEAVPPAAAVSQPAAVNSGVLQAAAGADTVRDGGGEAAAEPQRPDSAAPTGSAVETTTASDGTRRTQPEAPAATTTAGRPGAAAPSQPAAAPGPQQTAAAPAPVNGSGFVWVYDAPTNSYVRAPAPPAEATPNNATSSTSATNGSSGNRASSAKGSNGVGSSRGSSAAGDGGTAEIAPQPSLGSAAAIPPPSAPQSAGGRRLAQSAASGGWQGGFLGRWMAGGGLEDGGGTEGQQQPARAPTDRLPPVPASKPRDTCVCAFDFDGVLRAAPPGARDQDVPAPDAKRVVQGCKMHYDDKSITLGNIIKYYDTQPGCVMLFDDQEWNKAYASDLGVLMIMTPTNAGIRYADFTRGASELQRFCDCATPTERSYSAFSLAPSDRSYLPALQAAKATGARQKRRL